PLMGIFGQVAVAFVVLLLVGPGAADADELSDLRAQMVLLRQKMDQLAQFAPGTTGGAAYGTHAVPGAGMVGGSLARSFLIPGTDTSMRIGGTADLTAGYFVQNRPATRRPRGNRGSARGLRTPA